MTDISEKLLSLNQIKHDIKGAIEDKGVEITNSTPFSDYADKIGEIETGGGGYGLNGLLVIAGSQDTQVPNDIQGISGNTPQRTGYIDNNGIFYTGGLWMGITPPNYAKPPLSTADSWEWQVKAKIAGEDNRTILVGQYNPDLTSVTIAQPCIRGFNFNSNVMIVQACCGWDDDTSTWVFSTWDMAKTMPYEPSIRKNNYTTIRFGFDGTKYYCYLKRENDSNYSNFTLMLEVESSQKMDCPYTPMIGCHYPAHANTSEKGRATYIDLKECYLKVNGEIWWQPWRS